MVRVWATPSMLYFFSLSHTDGYEPGYYNNGATDEENERYWEQAKRVPFISWWPYRCRRCGQPDLGPSAQPNNEWDKYVIQTSLTVVEHSGQGGHVCEKCFQIIKGFIDNPEKED